MAQMIFVNLPVTDLDRSKAFFEALGFSINPMFTDETAACVVISDTICAMLLTHEKFRQFTSKEIVDASRATEVEITLSRDTRVGVDSIVQAALDAGGNEPRPAEDYGFMYQRGFEDPDGHSWGVIWMDRAQFPGAGNA